MDSDRNLAKHVAKHRIRRFLNTLVISLSDQGTCRPGQEHRPGCSVCREVREWSGSQMADLPGVCVSGAVVRAVFVTGHTLILSLVDSVMRFLVGPG